MTKDMTSGNPFRLLLYFSIPLLLGTIFQQLYNLVDSIIVGRYLGIQELSAIGATGSVNYLVMEFCTGICTGFSIPIAQQFGAKKYDRMRKFVMNGTYLAIFFAILVTSATTIFCRELFTLMKTPEEIIDNTCAYMFVIFAGIPFTPPLIPSSSP